MSRLPSAVRQQAIRKHLARQPGAPVGLLAAELGVSEMTIRRDFAALEAKAQVQRTHGGAVLTERMILEFDYRERLERNRDAKRAIAKLVDDNRATHVMHARLCLRNLHNNSIERDGVVVADNPLAYWRFGVRHYASTGT